jgi:hypothetical protein
MISIDGLYMYLSSPLPQVNYVALSPIPSTVDEDDPLTIRSVFYDLDPVVDMVISSIGSLDIDLLTLVTTLDMMSF